MQAGYIEVVVENYKQHTTLNRVLTVPSDHYNIINTEVKIEFHVLSECMEAMMDGYECQRCECLPRTGNSVGAFTGTFDLCKYTIQNSMTTVGVVCGIQKSVQ